MLNIILFFFAFIGNNHFYFKSSMISCFDFNADSISHIIINNAVKSSLRDIYNNAQLGYKVIKNGDQYFLHVGCTFDVYLINQGGQLEKSYKQDDNGYTCGNTFFERDNEVYSLFGNGLWSGHADLMAFDVSLGSWDFEYTENQPLDYYTELVFQAPEGIMALFGSRYNPRKKLNEAEQNGYYLDWNSKKWVRVYFDLVDDYTDYDFHSKISGQLIESANYFLFTSNEEFGKKGWFIVDKTTFQIKFLKKGNSDFFQSPYLSVVDDQIFFTRSSGDFFELDLNNEFNNGKYIGTIMIENEKEEIMYTNFGADKKNSILLILFVMAMLISIVYLFKRFSIHDLLSYRKPSFQILSQDKGVYPSISREIKAYGIEKYLDKLVKLESEVISTEEMDTILEINDVPSFDNKRSKRAKIIREINQYYINIFGFTLITRIKSDGDKRFICYKIDQRFKLSLSN